MSFLRLGTACAVFDDDGRVLLSRRGDMNVWNLPTGRLDAYEPIQDAASREVLEETGVQVGIERPVGLYYFEASRRMNILFSGYPLGGELQKKTSEAKDNQYFWPSSMPERLFADYMVHDAVENKKSTIRHITTPPSEMRKVRQKLAWRWVRNFLAGRPEPKHVRFQVASAGVIWNEDRTRFLLFEEDWMDMLPMVIAGGYGPPWVELTMILNQYGLDVSPLEWVGVWQQVSMNTLVFVFTGVAPEIDVLPHGKWVSAQTHTLTYPNANFLEQTIKSSADGGVWILTESMQPPNVIDAK